MSVLSENIQELLDAGFSRGRVAKELGVHHEIVKRTIRRYKLEFYEPFDTEDSEIASVFNFEWLYEEDLLEELFSRAYEKYYIMLPDDSEITRGDNNHVIFRYLKRKYGGLRKYAKAKNLMPLLEFFHKKCKVCGEIKRLDYFTDNSRSRTGLEPRCKKCFRDNYEKYCVDQTVYLENRRALRVNLPNTWTQTQKASIFENMCVFTGEENPHYDHWIALATGHGGTYHGNMVPINREDNSNKRARNPNEWIKDRPDIDAKRYRDVTKKLSLINGLTLDEYRQFVDWCYANPRSLADIQADNKRYGYVVPSLVLWREATGIAFPVRLDLPMTNEV